MIMVLSVKIRMGVLFGRKVLKYYSFKGFAVAVATSSKEYQSLGIDLEQMDRLKPRSIARIVHELEQDSIKGDVSRGTVLFALKESFYKAQFPIYKKKLNFKDVAFSIDFDSMRSSSTMDFSKN